MADIQLLLLSAQFDNEFEQSEHAANHKQLWIMKSVKYSLFIMQWNTWQKTDASVQRYCTKQFLFIYSLWTSMVMGSRGDLICCEKNGP